MVFIKKWNIIPLAQYLIIGLIGAIIFCGYWWFTGKIFNESLSTTQMPLIRNLTLQARVPFNLGDGILIPDYEPRGDAGLFYSEISFLSKIAFNPMAKGSTEETPVLPETAKPKNDKDVSEFLAELSQYTILSCIDDLQRTKHTVLGPSASRPAIVPPELTIYPKGTLSEALDKNRFSRIGQEPQRFYVGYGFKAPKDTIVKFTKHGGDSLVSSTYVVELTNQSLYSLKISIYVGLIVGPIVGKNNLDGYVSIGFRIPPEIVPKTKIYNLVVNCQFEFYRKADTDAFQQQEYEKWALALFSGLQTMLGD